MNQRRQKTIKDRVLSRLTKRKREANRHTVEGQGN